MSVGSTPENLQQVIRNLDVLPAMPAIAQKLLSLDLSTSKGEREMLLLIEQDPQISAKLIGLANSPAVGAMRKIRTVREATALLGLTRAQSVASGIAILSLMAKKPTGRFTMQELWLHGLGVAFAMLAVARAMPANMRPPEDQIFLAGMLHDIGYLVLAYLDRALSDRLHERLAVEPNRPLAEIEREVLGTSHAELGAGLAIHWHLPEEIVGVLRYHHRMQEPEAARLPLVRLVGLAEKLLPAFGINEHIVAGVTAAEWSALGIDPADVAEIREQVAEQADQASQFASAFAY